MLKNRARLLVTLLFWVLLGTANVMCLVEVFRQRQDSQYVRSVAREIVKTIPPEDLAARVLVIRDYLRQKVTYQGAVYERRLFFRASAMETLQSGKGYCGEVSRAFIRLAYEVGIRAQRVYLYGDVLHVVAEAQLNNGARVIVDCQTPPSVENLLPLEQVMQRPEYDFYSNLNMRRFKLQRWIPSVKLEMGSFSYWQENPHAMQAFLWGCLALVLLMTCGLWTVGGPGWQNLSGKAKEAYARQRALTLNAHRKNWLE
jgi:hypothetical protein